MSQGSSSSIFTSTPHHTISNTHTFSNIGMSQENIREINNGRGEGFRKVESSPTSDHFYGIRSASSRSEQTRNSSDGKEWGTTGNKRSRFENDYSDTNTSTRHFEMEIKRLERQLEEERVIHLRQSSRLESELRNERLQVEQKDSKIKRLLRDNLEAEELQKKMNFDLQMRKSDFEQRIKELEKEKQEIQNQCDEEVRLLAENNSVLLQQRQEVIDAVEELQMQLDIEKAKNQPAPSKQNVTIDRFPTEQINRLENQVQRLEREKEQLRLQVIAAEMGAACGGRASELSLQLKQSESRERDLKRLVKSQEAKFNDSIDAHQRVSILEEQIKRLTEQQSQLLSAEAERDKLMRERKEWEKLFYNILGEGTKREQFSPHNVLSVLNQLRVESVNAVKTCSEAKIDLSVANVNLNNKEKMVQELQTRMSKLEAKLTEALEAKGEVEHRNAFLENQYKSLLVMVEEVQKETFMMANKDDQGKPQFQELEQRCNQTISELRNNLSKANDEIAKLQNDTSVRDKRLRELESSESQQSGMESKHKKLIAEHEKALDRIAELERAVNSGAFNPSQTKVIHFKNNPTDMRAKDEISNLRAEVERLRSRTQGSPPSNGEDATIRYERLKQVFRENIKNFKEAVYLLTGLEINMTADLLIVRSMFAERPSDQLQFTWKSGSKPALLESEYLETLDENTIAYYNNCHSIPAFLSTLTLDLFGKQTLAIG